ncbi:IclR family transcriptional regulator (plasmid) [Haloferacaceae archaeon DSL9]
MRQKGNTSSGRVKATQLSLDILDEIRRRDGAGVTELATHFEHSKSTVHSHLRTLELAGYLRNDDGYYTLGLRALQLGGHARARHPLYRLAKDEVDELARETGETSKIVVEDGGKGVYLYQARSKRAVTTDSHVGTHVFLHSTAVGKAVLAHLDGQRRDEILDEHGLPEVTPNTVTDRGALASRLERIRDRGVAFDDGERIEGLRCIAAPIKTREEVLGAISVSGPKKRINDELFRTRLPELVQDTARVIEINATYS